MLYSVYLFVILAVLGSSFAAEKGGHNYTYFRGKCTAAISEMSKARFTGAVSDTDAFLKSISKFRTNIDLYKKQLFNGKKLEISAEVAADSYSRKVLRFAHKKASSVSQLAKKFEALDSKIDPIWEESTPKDVKASTCAAIDSMVRKLETLLAECKDITDQINSIAYELADNDDAFGNAEEAETVLSTPIGDLESAIVALSMHQTLNCEPEAA